MALYQINPVGGTLVPPNSAASFPQVAAANANSQDIPAGIIKWSGSYYACVYCPSGGASWILLTWTPSVTSYQQILIPGSFGTMLCNSSTFEIVGSTLILGLQPGFGSGQYYAEYSLSSFVDGLPTVATSVVPPTGISTQTTASVMSCKNQSAGSVCLITSVIGQTYGKWNNIIAYRSASASWSVQTQNYQAANPVGPKFTSLIDASNVLYIMMSSDAQGVITLSRYQDSGSALTFLDFRRQFIQQGSVDADPVLMQPDFENPTPTLFNDSVRGDWILAYTGSYGSSSFPAGCCNSIDERVAPPVFVSVKTIPQPSNPSSTVSQSGNLFTISYPSVPGVAYLLQRTQDGGTTWVEVNREKIAVGTTDSQTDAPVFGPTYAWRVLGLSYTKTLLFNLYSSYSPQVASPGSFLTQMERTSVVWSASLSSQSLCFYMNTTCCTPTVLWRYNYNTGSASQLFSGHTLAATTQDAPNPFVIVDINGQTFLDDGLYIDGPEVDPSKFTPIYAPSSAPTFQDKFGFKWTGMLPSGASNILLQYSFPAGTITPGPGITPPFLLLNFPDSSGYWGPNVYGFVYKVSGGNGPVWNPTFGYTTIQTWQWRAAWADSNGNQLGPYTDWQTVDRRNGVFVSNSGTISSVPYGNLEVTTTQTSRGPMQTVSYG